MLEVQQKLNQPREDQNLLVYRSSAGSGKTYTAVSEIYRLIKFSKAKRILFLVDTKNLGLQAENEFQAYKPLDDHRRFTELYQVQRLTTSSISRESKVCISTIQRMYSMIKGEKEAKVDEEGEVIIDPMKAKEPITYNKKIPP